MDRVFEEISNPVFWFSVVIVGLLVNVASSYLLKLLDAQVSKVSKTRSEKQAKRQQVELMLVEELRTDHQKQINMQFRIIEDHFRAVWFMLLAVALSTGSVFIEIFPDVHLTYTTIPYSSLFFPINITAAICWTMWIFIQRRIFHYRRLIYRALNT